MSSPDHSSKSILPLEGVLIPLTSQILQDMEPFFIHRHSPALHLINREFQRKTVRLKQTIRNHPRQNRRWAELEEQAVLLHPQFRMLEKYLFRNHKGVSILDMEVVLPVLPVKHSLLQHSDPVLLSTYDRPDLSSQNQFETQLKLPAPMMCPPFSDLHLKKNRPTDSCLQGGSGYHVYVRYTDKKRSGDSPCAMNAALKNARAPARAVNAYAFIMWFIGLSPA